MLEQLRIQCPSCGIILDVRNSKYEAFKQITCPNCKKRLAVNFEEELEPLAPPQPIAPLYYGEMRIDLQEGINKIALPDSDKVEIKVVRLKDGNSKCLVRPLDDTISVRVNGQQLQREEQVALSKGDYLEIGKTALRAGEPGLLIPDIHAPEERKSSEPQKPKKEHNFIWLNTAIAFVVLMGATIYLWPSKNDTGKDMPKPEKEAQVTDTTKKKPSDVVYKPKKDTVRPSVVSPKAEPRSKDHSKMSDYDLEMLAGKGDTEAQYALGVNLIKRGGVCNVVRGINYLKLAAGNGSSKAKAALGKAISSLQKQASQGDSISYKILENI